MRERGHLTKNALALGYTVQGSELPLTSSAKAHKAAKPILHLQLECVHWLRSLQALWWIKASFFPPLTLIEVNDKITSAGAPLASTRWIEVEDSLAQIQAWILERLLCSSQWKGSQCIKVKCVHKSVPDWGLRALSEIVTRCRSALDTFDVSFGFGATKRTGCCLVF